MCIRDSYKGKIYKTTNMLGQALAQYCTTDSAMTKEQKRIEQELLQFEKGLFGTDEVKKDSLDSIASLDPKAAKAAAKAAKKRTRRAGGTTKATKAPKSRVSSGGSSPRVSVRRERH